MRFRLGLVIGVAIGYWFGAKAGRSRYEQMERWLHKARESDLTDVAVDKAKAVIDLAQERARAIQADYSPSR